MKMKYFYFKVLFCCVFEISVMARDPASEQLMNYKEAHSYKTIVETGFGAPVSNIAVSLTAGPRGPILLQDKVFLDTITHFNRERIPERVVHAKGAGAFGYFEVTEDISNYTKAVLFSEVGKQTKIAVRFSTVTYQPGSIDTVRNPRGFSIKFYSEQGIWDLVGLSLPVFFITDPIEFPNFIHSMKKNPVTNLLDKDMFWDYILGSPEITYAIVILFSDLGTPDGYRHMDGYGVNAYKMVNASGEAVYVKFHFKPHDGIKNLTMSEATERGCSDSDYAVRDLYNAIASGVPPSWTFYIQVMTFEEAENLPWNPFDPTKIWPEEQFQLIEVGNIVLNENPTNFFAQIEQIAFDPGNLIPGIEVSPDKLLQGRLFAYSDAQRYRLGANFIQLPPNCPFSNRMVNNYERDGRASFYNKDGAPNYYPNSFGGPENDPEAASSTFYVSGDVARYNTSDEDNFSQASDFWNKLTSDQKENLKSNLASYLEGTALFLQKRAISMFSKVNQDIGDAIQKHLKIS